MSSSIIGTNHARSYLPIYFQGEESTAFLTDLAKYEDAGELVFLYAPEVEGLIYSLAPLAVKSVQNLVAVLLYEFLFTRSQEGFVHNATTTLNDYARDALVSEHLFRLRINRLTEQVLIERTTATIIGSLDWIYRQFYSKNRDVVIDAMELTNVGYDFEWLGVLNRRYVLLPIHGNR